MSDFPIRWKTDDQADADSETVEQIAERMRYEGEVSALVEAQLLEVLGKLGAIRTVLLRALADPNRRTNTPESRAIRTALTLANEGVTLAQAITMSTARRGGR